MTSAAFMVAFPIHKFYECMHAGINSALSDSMTPDRPIDQVKLYIQFIHDSEERSTVHVIKKEGFPCLTAQEVINNLNYPTIFIKNPLYIPNEFKKHAMHGVARACLLFKSKNDLCYSATLALSQKSKKLPVSQLPSSPQIEDIFEKEQSSIIIDEVTPEKAEEHFKQVLTMFPFQTTANQLDENKNFVNTF